MKRKGIFAIQQYTNASGTLSWRVTGTKLNGERVRRNFATEAEAIGEKQRLEIEAANMPAAPDLKRTPLTVEQIREAERAFEDLAGRSLTEAVKFFLENKRAPKTDVLVRDAFQQFMTEKAGQGLRPDSLQNLRVKVGFLAAKHPEVKLSDLTAEAVNDVICAPSRGLRARDNVRRAISCFFSWAVEKEFCVANPVTKIKPFRYEKEEPIILPLPKCRALLTAAAAYKDGVVMPYVALGLFCAIRPKELARLTWDDIDLENKTVTITGKAAKKRARRIVEISDNCVKWLLPHVVKRTPIVGPNWRRDFDAVKESAGYGTPTEANPNLKEWVPDVLRHTGISCHFAQHQHEGKTATWAGNSPDVIHSAYRALVKPPEAAEFWEISPSGAKIVKLKKLKKVAGERE